MNIYETLGEANIKKMVTLFYESVANDELIRPMYPKELAPAEDRLFLFLVQVFGGPTTYSEKRGHPKLRKRHFPYAIDMEARNRWMQHMTAAMTEIEMSSELEKQILEYFERAATHMMNR
jgi:hemoglobin